MIDQLADKFRKITMVIFDVDGVLTDNTVYMGPDEFELKRFCIADGLGIHMAKKHGLIIAFLSGRFSAATVSRARELGVVDVIHGSTNKLEGYESLKAKYNLKDENIIYVGNDLIDLDVMRKCGLPVAVPDSPQSVLKAAQYITQKAGGFGAAREILDLLLEARGIDEEKRLN
jgi:3-deoxy-D-manno-octulosonate 8-phosphate phosphatase (KDO 8-P phosphatase)